MAYGEKMHRLSPCSDELICGEIAAIMPKVKSILDVGCGRGERMKALKESFSESEVFGVDNDEGMVSLACGIGKAFLAGAENLPFENKGFELALCECSLSLFADAEKALEEMARVLKDESVLLLGELFAPLGGEDFVSVPDGRALGRIYSREKLEKIAKSAGFEMLKFSDRSEDLAAMAAQMLFDGSFCECVGMETAMLLRRLKVRYGLWIFKKGRETV